MGDERNSKHGLSPVLCAIQVLLCIENCIVVPWLLKDMTRTKTQKMRAKAARKVESQRAPKRMTAGPKKSGKSKKWYLSVQTPWGSGNMGSGEKLVPAGPPGKSRSRGRNAIDLVGPETGATNQIGSMTQIVAQDEVIGVIPGSVDFACTPFPIQPGLVSTFPWMEGFGSKFEFYRFKLLEFYFKPIVSPFADQGQKGKVILSADYDSASGDLQNYRQAETMNPHADGMPYQSIRLRLDPARLTPKEGKYLRVGNVPAGTDVKTYDAGQFYFSTQGCTNTDDVGELRVRYVVELINPRLPNAAPPPVNYTWSEYSMIGGGAPALAASLTWQAVVWNTIVANGLGVTSLGGGSYQVTAGAWRVSSHVQFTASVAPAGSAYVSAVRISKNGVAVNGALSVSAYPLGSLYSVGSVDYVVLCNDGDILTVDAEATYAGGTTVTLTGNMVLTLA